MFWKGRREPALLGEVLHSDDDYRVTFKRGDSDVSIIAFLGVGLALNGIQTEEFRGSLGDTPNIYFIADLRRSWWNAGVVERVLEKALRHATNGRLGGRLSVLGNSMGGSGAILACHLYREIERCLAFVPQADIRLSAAESRWLEYRRPIRDHRWPVFTLQPLSADQKIVFGEGDDDFHRRLFMDAGMPVILYDGHGHTLARDLRDRSPTKYQSLLDFVSFCDAGSSAVRNPDAGPQLRR